MAMCLDHRGAASVHKGSSALFWEPSLALHVRIAQLASINPTKGVLSVSCAQLAHSAQSLGPHQTRPAKYALQDISSPLQEAHPACHVLLVSTSPTKALLLAFNVPEEHSVLLRVPYRMTHANHVLQAYTSQRREARPVFRARQAPIVQLKGRHQVIHARSVLQDSTSHTRTAHPASRALLGHTVLLLGPYRTPHASSAQQGSISL